MTAFLRAAGSVVGKLGETGRGDDEISGCSVRSQLPTGVARADAE
jgi:hypothetical protein